MIDHQQIMSAIRNSTAEVFSTMLELTVEPIEELTGQPRRTLDENLVAMVGLAGVWSGVGSLRCGPTLAGILAARLLMMDEPEDSSISNETLDAIAELANMIVGNVKTTLEDRLGAMGITIPTVIYGRNFTVRQAGLEESLVRFRCGNDEFEVCIGLAESHTNQHAQERISHVLLSSPG